MDILNLSNLSIKEIFDLANSHEVVIVGEESDSVFEWKIGSHIGSGEMSDVYNFIDNDKYVMKITQLESEYMDVIESFTDETYTEYWKRNVVLMNQCPGITAPIKKAWLVNTKLIFPSFEYEEYGGEEMIYVNLGVSILEKYDITLEVVLKNSKYIDYELICEVIKNLYEKLNQYNLYNFDIKFDNFMLKNINDIPQLDTIIFSDFDFIFEINSTQSKKFNKKSQISDSFNNIETNISSEPNEIKLLEMLKQKILI